MVYVQIRLINYRDVSLIKGKGGIEHCPDKEN